MNEVLILVIIGFVIFLLSIISILLKLLTKNGRLKLKSWVNSEYVDVGHKHYLVMYDFNGFPISWKLKQDVVMSELRNKVWSKMRDEPSNPNPTSR